MSRKKSISFEFEDVRKVLGEYDINDIAYKYSRRVKDSGSIKPKKLRLYVTINTPAFLKK